jgi:hypothetical protein
MLEIGGRHRRIDDSCSEGQAQVRARATALRVLGTPP